MFKKIRNMLILTAVSTAIFFATTGCGLFDTEAKKVEKIIEAYQSGDADKFMKYAEGDEAMALIMGALDEKDADGMTEVLQKVHEMSKDFSYTVEDNDHSSDGTVIVTLESLSFSESFPQALTEAIYEGGEAFENMPAWLLKTLEKGGEKAEYEVEVHIYSDGSLLEDGHNDDFFYALTGGFYDFATATMTSCTLENYEDACYMVAVGDELIMSLDESFISDEGIEYTDEEVAYIKEEMLADYEGAQGISVDIIKVTGGLRFIMYINYNVASDATLEHLDIVTDGWGDYISLEESIESFEADGFNCVTKDFGSGVLD